MKDKVNDNTTSKYSNKPLISIIVPVYNSEKYLSKCLDSLLRQNYNNIEILLIDDKSTDNSPSIIKEYESKDNRIKALYNENNMGVSYSRNKGIENSVGEYISFVDSDDLVSKSYISRLYTICKDNNSDISMCDYFVNCNISDDNDSTINKDIQISNFTPLEFLELIAENESQYTVVWNKLYKKELFNNVKFPEGRVFEDLYIMSHIIDNARHISFTNEKLYYYYKRENSITMKPFSIKSLDIVEGNISKVEYFKEKCAVDDNYKPLYEKSVLNLLDTTKANYYKSLKYITNDEEKEKAIKMCKETFEKYYPSQTKNIKMSVYKRLIYYIHYRFPKMGVILYSIKPKYKNQSFVN